MTAETMSVPVVATDRFRSTLQIVGWCGLGLIGIVAAMNDFMAQAPADAQGVGALLQPPSLAMPFGTDVLGRDVLSEVLHALAITLVRGLLGTAVTLLTGAVLGFIAARLARPVSWTLRWVVTAPSSVPALLLALLIAGIAGRDQSAIAAGIAAAPIAFVRAYDRTRRGEQSVAAAFARATGIAPSTLLRRDLVYEFRDHMLSTAARALAAVTIILSTASFLGFGATPPHRDLGLMIAAAQTSYLTAWWTALMPALALILLVLFARLAAGLNEGESA